MDPLTTAMATCDGAHSPAEMLVSCGCSEGSTCATASNASRHTTMQQLNQQQLLMTGGMLRSCTMCCVQSSSLRSPLRQQHTTLPQAPPTPFMPPGPNGNPAPQPPRAPPADPGSTLHEPPVLHDLFHRCAQLCRRLADGHTSSLQGSNLVGRLALAARDDSTRVAHAATRGCGQTCDQSNTYGQTHRDSGSAAVQGKPT